MALRRWSDLSDAAAANTVYIGVAVAPAGEVPTHMTVVALDTTEQESDGIIDVFDGYRNRAQEDGFMASLARIRDGRHLAVVPGRQQASQPAPRGRRGRSTAGDLNDEAQKIRAWAAKTGREVSPYGRLPKDVVADYHETLKASPAPVATVKTVKAPPAAVPAAKFTGGSTS